MALFYPSSFSGIVDLCVVAHGSYTLVCLLSKNEFILFEARVRVRDGISPSYPIEFE